MLLNFLRGLVRRTAREEPSPCAHTAQDWLQRGIRWQAEGRFHDAEAALRSALALEPDHLDALHVLGIVLCDAGRTTEGVGVLERVARQQPERAEVHIHLGGVYNAMGMTEKSLTSFRAAISANPNLAASYNNLGNVYHQIVELVEAEAAYLKAVELAPQLDDVWCNLGRVQVDLGKAEQSISSYRRGLSSFAAGKLKVTPDATKRQAEALWNLSLALLATGDFELGWSNYELRFDPRVAVVRPRSLPHALWNGESLLDRTLLVWGEQGVGDEILFAATYPDLLALGGRYVFECHAKLVPVFARAFPWAQVVERTEPAHLVASDGVDFQIAAGSLGRHLRPSISSFPPRVSYLRADASRLRYWCERLADLGPALKVGFCWRSGNLKAERALACTQLEQWGELFRVKGVHWISLQYDDCEAELARARSSFGVTLHRFAEVDYFDDLDEVSALMGALDLVISAPTTVSVHAAALGLEVWQLTYGTDWRTHGTGGVPWCPTMREYRRQPDQDWEDIIGRIALNLREQVERSP